MAPKQCKQKIVNVIYTGQKLPCVKRHWFRSYAYGKNGKRCRVFYGDLISYIGDVAVGVWKVVA